MMHERIIFPKLSTPHDLAMCLGPWIALSFVLAAFASICAENWLGFVHIFLAVLNVDSVVRSFFERTVHCHALYGKYATKGIPLQGSVIRTWKTTEREIAAATNVQVLYQVDDFQYSKELQWPQKQPRTIHDAVESSAADIVDLLCLPGYPKSALLHDFVKTVDADFPPPPRAQDLLAMAILFVTPYFFICPSYIPVFALVPVHAWMLLPFWTASNVVLIFACAYWIATTRRESKCQRLLYGATLVQNEVGAAPLVSSEEHVSYEEFCQVDPNHRLSYSAILRIAVECTLWAAYYGAFFGTYLIWYGLVVPRWKRTLIKSYDLKSGLSFVVGSVVSKNLMDSMGVIVQYEADDNRMYKKRLDMPVEVSQNMPDNPELVYFKGLPESAIFKEGTLLDPGPAQNTVKQQMPLFICLGLFCMAYQVGFLTWLVSECSGASPFWVAGILLVVQCAMGFVGVWIRYQTVIEKEILGGAKQVEDRSISVVHTIETHDVCVRGPLTLRTRRASKQARCTLV
jgi:hypothetical protein